MSLFSKNNLTVNTPKREKRKHSKITVDDITVNVNINICNVSFGFNYI